MKVDTTVDVDFIVPSIPEYKNQEDIFVRFSTLSPPNEQRTLMVEIHILGRVTRVEVGLDAYRAGWVDSWKAGNDRAVDAELLNLLREEEEKDAQ